MVFENLGITETTIPLPQGTPDSNSIAYHHPTYINNFAILQRTIACFKGKTAWWNFPLEGYSTTGTNTWLSQLMLPPRMKEGDAYNERLRSSVFYEYFRESVQWFAAMLSSFDVLPDNLYWMGEDERKNFLSDVDGFGTDLSTFVYRALLESLTQNFVVIMVDRNPKVQGPKKQKEGRLVLSFYDRDSMINWRTEESGDAQQLILAVFKEQQLLPDGDYGVKAGIKYTKVCLGQTNASMDGGLVTSPIKGYTVVRHTFYGGPSDGEKNPVGAPTFANNVVLDKLPLVLFPFESNVNTGRPFLYGLVDLNCYHYELKSFHQTYLRRMVPCWHRVGWQGSSEQSTEGSKNLYFSSDLIIDHREGVTMEPLEFSGSGIAPMETELVTVQQRMDDYVLKFFQGKGGKPTATEVLSEAHKQEAQFTAISKGIEQSIAQVMRLMAERSGVELDPNKPQGIKIKTNMSALNSSFIVQVFTRLYERNAVDREFMFELLNALKITPDSLTGPLIELLKSMPDPPPIGAETNEQ